MPYFPEANIHAFGRRQYDFALELHFVSLPVFFDSVKSLHDPHNGIRYLGQGELLADAYSRAAVLRNWSVGGNALGQKEKKISLQQGLIRGRGLRTNGT